MSTVFAFQPQLVSIMDALSKAAVLEISKLVEIESKVLKIEISQGRNEIASLTEKLQLMENLLWLAQGHSRQEDTAGRPRTPEVRDAPGNNCYGRLEPGKKTPAIKSESPCESVCSSNQMRSLEPGEDYSLIEPTNAAREQPELILIKEEPIDVDSGTERERTNEKGGDSEAQRRSSNMHQHLKAILDKPHAFTAECFATPSGARPSAADPGTRRETQWVPSAHFGGHGNHQQQQQHANLPPPAHANANANHPEAARGFTPRSVVSSQGLAKNVKMHSLRSSASVKRFGCLQCGKSFRCFSQLEIHQRSHTGEKPFRCTLCGKRYAQKGHLYTHQRTHTGEKPYRCPICGKGFIQKCTLDMHHRTHTGEKPFVCAKCGKGFTKNCNLKKHLAVHIDTSAHLYSSSSRVPIFLGTNGDGAPSDSSGRQL